MAGEIQTAADLVQQRVEDTQQFALDAFNAAQQLVTVIGTTPLPEPPASVSYTMPELVGGDFQLPTEPSTPTINPHLPAVPAPPSFSSISLPSVDSLPSDNLGSAPAITLPSAPSPLNITAPAAPTLQPIGDAPSNLPTISDIAAPDLYELQIPVTPTLSLPQFTAVPPAAPILAQQVDFDYTSAAYSERILPGVEAVLRAFLDRLSQQGGMPDEIEQILFEKARVRETVVARKAIEEATQEWSSRGFSLPQGELNKRVDEARARAQDAASTLSRETMIRSHDVRLENLRFAVQQGIVFEGQLIALHNEEQRRLMESAQISARLVIEYFNLKVTAFNAQITSFNAQAEVYRAQLQAETQKIELFRGQLEAERLRGELNEQQIRVYSERLRAQLTRVELFKATVEAYRAKVEGVLATVQLHRGQVEAFSAQVDAKRAEFSAYGEATRAATAPIEVYKASTQAYGERVRAYAAKQEASLNGARIQLENRRFTLEAYQANMANIRAQIEQVSETTRTQLSAYEATARVYSAKVGAVQARSEAELARWRAELEAARASADVAITNAKSISDHADRVFTLLQDAQKVAAQVQSQIAAGAMSAVNMSASLGSSGSFTQDKNVSIGVSYGVDGGEAPAPVIPYY